MTGIPKKEYMDLGSNLANQNAVPDPLHKLLEKASGESIKSKLDFSSMAEVEKLTNALEPEQQRGPSETP